LCSQNRRRGLNLLTCPNDNNSQPIKIERDKTLETPKFKLSDILYGLVVPLILVLLIFVLAVYVNPGGSYHLLGIDGLGGTIAIIFTQGFSKMIVLGIPLILGLIWNKWAGGAAGFIMGGAYYLAYSGYATASYAAYGVFDYNFFGDMSFLFYLVNAIMIGYIAGSLSNGSANFKRMLGAGLTAAITTQVIQTLMDLNYSLKPARDMAVGVWTSDPVYAFVLAFVPSIALGVIIPILAKVMSWYGLSARKQ
jgi:hypothetical protein